MASPKTVARLAKRLEAAEREQRVQAVVDRVLQRALAMNTAEDIAHVVELTRDAVADLGLDPVLTNIAVFDEARDLVHAWHTWQDRSVVVRQGYKLSLAALRKSGSKYHTPRRGRQRLAVIRMNRRQLTSELNKNRKALMPDGPKWGVAGVVAGFTFPNYRHNFYFSGGWIGLDYPRELTKPEIAVGRRIADAFDVAYRRFVELQAKEQRARDAEVEAALERVRGRAQGMQSSNEMGAVTEVLFDEMQGLGSELQVSMFNLMNHADRSWEQVAAGSFGSTKPTRCALEGIPAGLFRRTYLKTFDAWTRGDTSFTIEIPEQEFHDWRLHSSLAHGASRSRARKWARDRPRINAYHYRIFHGYGFLNFVAHGQPLTDEDLQTAHRFTAIFDYAYRRFHELEQKETQNRELMIQNALERVRARALGMQESSELGEVVWDLHEQVRDLGIDVTSTRIRLWDEAKGGREAWLATQLIPRSEGPAVLPGGHKPPRLAEMRRCLEAGEPWHVYKIPVSAKRNILVGQFADLLKDRGATDREINKRLADVPKNLWNHRIFYSQGYVSFIAPAKLDTSDRELLKRFTDIFDFAYQRFLELEQKEQLVREAQIEVSLERVRAKALSLQNSTELFEVAAVLFDQFRSLGFDTHSTLILVWDLTSGTGEWWSSTGRHARTSSRQTPGSLSAQVSKDVARARAAGADWHVLELEGDRVQQYAREIAESTGISEQVIESTWISSDRLVQHRIFHQRGSIIIGMPSRLPDADLVIAKRFASVFDFAYARFLELKASEARAHEAQLEAASERVRAAAIDMRSTDDIHLVVGVLRHELIRLGFSDRFPININHLDGAHDGLCPVYFSAPNPRQIGLSWTAPELREIDERIVAALEFQEIAPHLDLFTSQAVWHANLSNDTEHLAYTEAILARFGIEPGYGALFEIGTHATGVPFAQGQIVVRGNGFLTDDQVDIVRQLGNGLSLGFTRFQDFQQLEQSSNNKSQFLRRMSHDLRSPMNAIIGYSRLVLRKARGTLDERQVRNIANIETSSGNLLNLINDILDLSRIEAGRIEVNVQPVDVRQLVEECSLALEPIVKPGVSLNRHLAQVGQVSTDPERLRQVVMNLLGNATKFTEAGSITLSLKRDDDGAVELSVADTGIGIPPEDLPHIFDEFRQVERQGGEQSEGTGLGLAIASKTVELLGGQIMANSEVGVGTTFTVRIPCLVTQRGTT
jgi:signal transduction histidine kinase